MDRDTIENLRLVAKENPKPVIMLVENGDLLVACRKAYRSEDFNRFTKGI